MTEINRHLAGIAILKLKRLSNGIEESELAGLTGHELVMIAALAEQRLDQLVEGETEHVDIKFDMTALRAGVSALYELLNAAKREPDDLSGLMMVNPIRESIPTLAQFKGPPPAWSEMLSQMGSAGSDDVVKLADLPIVEINNIPVTGDFGTYRYGPAFSLNDEQASPDYELEV